MPAKLATPVTKEFKLSKTDADHGNTGDPTTVVVRQAATGEILSRNLYFAPFEQTVDEEGHVINKSEIAVDVVRRKEAFLTMVDCNYLDEDGKQLFKFKDGRPVSESSFNAAWGKLPEVVSSEIIECVLEINPQWGPQGNS